VIVLALVVAALTSCTGGSPQDEMFGECAPLERLALVAENAAGRAWTCGRYLEVGGEAYSGWGCNAVDPSFLGPITARSENYVARSIKNAKAAPALAIRYIDDTSGRRCGGWQVWSRNVENHADQAAVNRLICRVQPEEIPVVPRWCRQHSVGVGNTSAFH
jgi:hypothetical protein